jgi:hypothetical protein
MIYRFLTKLATQERLEAFPQAVPGATNCIEFVPSIKEYEANFKTVKSKDSFAGVSQYEAPVMDKNNRFCIKFNHYSGQVSLPDIWGVEGYLVVSELFKTILAKHDKMRHQYLPIQWLDHNEQPIATEQTYYWFNPFRFLKITPDERIATPDELGFMPVPGEEDFVSRIKRDQALREWLESFPIWRHFGFEDIKGRQTPVRIILYFNETTFNALVTAGIEGIQQYSQPFGVGEEAVYSI